MESVVRIGKNASRAGAATLSYWNVQVFEVPEPGQCKAMVRAVLEDGRQIVFTLNEADYEALKYKLAGGATVVHPVGDDV